MAARILQYSDVENAYDDPERIARLAATIRAHRDADTLVCGTGDTTAPGLLSMETGGEHALDFFEAVAPDVATFGNHEFDLGLDDLAEVVSGSPQTWVTANLRGPEGDRPVLAEAGVRRWQILRAGSERVGLFGLTDPGTVQSHALTGDVTVEDPIPAAREAVSALCEEGVDRIVALSHLGRDDDELPSAVEVDAVLGGHTHGERAECVDGTVLTRPGARGRLVALVDFGSGDPELLPVPDAEPDGDVAARYRDLFAAVGLDETVAEVERPIERGPGECFPESRIGNVVVDAYRWVAGADVAICNAKMLRAGPPIAGEVRVGDLRSLTPFENDIHTAELTGQELRQLFENLRAPAVGLDVPEVFAHVSGASLQWRREDGIELAGATVQGHRPDPSKTYTVAAPSFAFHHDVFAPLSTERLAATHGDQHDALVGYVREEGIHDEVDGRMHATVDRGPDTLHSLR